MVLGRLFVWSAALAGGLLILAIGFLVWGQVTKNPKDELDAAMQSASNSESRLNSESSVNLDFQLEETTYHPTEALVAPLHRQASFQRRTTFSGELVSQHRSNLAFEMAGLVSDVKVDTGYRVKEGDPIATLDSSSLKLQKKSAAAELERAQAIYAEMKAGPLKTTLQAALAEVEAIDAELVNLKRQLNRQEQLSRDGVISDSELDSIRSLATATQKRKQAAARRLEELQAGTRPEQLAAQSALIVGLESQVELLDLQIEKAILKAPFDGVITETMVDRGAVVAAGQLVARIVDTKNLEAQIGVPREVAEILFAQDSGRETLPDKTTGCKLRVGDTAIDASLSRSLPVMDPATQTVLIVFDVDIATLPQFVAATGSQVAFDWEQTVQAEGYWVSNDSLTQARRGLWSLFVFEPMEEQTVKTDPSSERQPLEIPNAKSDLPPVLGLVHKVQVEILYSTENRSFVRGTLRPDQWIIDAGTQRLLDGQRVQVKTGRTSAEIDSLNQSIMQPLDFETE